ncbi:hypothetical protein SERLADRAFT_449248 [Serpula lacrymans var. lacrymans S7.9]|uniref:Nephrocystin 3-like N-terminal domain-containing protein n=1 Tax=Serpula lacrymans var. lacrymans (strain S7.9) TaxID=578457 RepID=F8NWZ7_SERL9|nr:uncharacterized protein SERLADRAFT_449248 [Serpula lacrymans var. lacrymans S7.9]EGO24472.1 hypothetical protein SERLADRAFT_449248 [Serpula lacrymans var. lacrymans S7.9]
MTAGAGKTVIAQSIDTAVAYIYCNYKEQPTVYDLVASLLKQLVEDFSRTFKDVASSYESHREKCYRPTLEEIHKTLMSEIKRFSQVFVVVDALDEITELGANRYELLKKLQSLECHLLVTSRDIKSIGDALRNALCMHVRAHESDIRQYIEGHILPGTTLEGLIATDPPLREEIVEGVTKHTDGM